MCDPGGSVPRHPSVRRPCARLRLGAATVETGPRPLVMGVLNRTVDSFFDKGAYFHLDDFLNRAEQLVAGGADILDVGARSAAVGTRDVSLAEETELVCSSVVALRRRFDTPVSVDTWRAPVVDAAFRSGAVVGNDVSGFSDAGYLQVAAAAGATVVATHMRLTPQVPDPDPDYRDVVEDVASALAGLVAAAEAAGLGRDRVAIDPGLDLGKTWRQSVRLLGAVSRFCDLGHAVLVAPSNKIFLGRLLGLDKDERAHATTAACVAALMQGARIIRVHDAAAGRQAADLVAALLA